MDTDNRKKGGHLRYLWFLCGACLLFSAGILSLLNLQEQKNAQSAAAELLSLVEETADPAWAESAAAASAQAPEDSASSQAEWYSWQVDGILSLPDLGLELPVLADYSEERLKASVCVYERDVQSKTERLIIAGHNYPAHFGKLQELPEGAIVYYTPLDAEQIAYQVIEQVEIAPDEWELLEAGEWDMTLFTCNWDMQKRFLLRCQIIT